MRRFLCHRRSTAQATLPIGAYVNDLYAVDKTLFAMIQKTEMEILRITKLGSSKHVARRRILLRRHKASIEERRDMILARILQLESLHINNLQIDEPTHEIKTIVIDEASTKTKRVCSTATLNTRSLLIYANDPKPKRPHPTTKLFDL